VCLLAIAGGKKVQGELFFPVFFCPEHTAAPAAMANTTPVARTGAFCRPGSPWQLRGQGDAIYNSAVPVCPGSLLLTQVHFPEQGF